MKQPPFLLIMLGTLFVFGVITISLYYSFGVLWFSMYGSSILLLGLLISVLLISKLFRKDTQKSDTAFWVISIFLCVVLLLHIGFWIFFFRYGSTNPELGLFREMIRPSLESYGPSVSIVFLITWIYTAIRSFRR